MVHFYRVQRQDELPRRAATFFLPQRLRFVQAVLSPKPRHWARQATWTRPQGPTQGTGNESRPLLPKLLPVTLDPHTDAIRSQATLEPRLTSGSVQVPQSHSRDQTYSFLTCTSLPLYYVCYLASIPADLYIITYALPIQTH